MKRLLSLLLLVGILALLATSCSKKGPIVAKVKGLKIYQNDLDTLFPEVRDSAARVERLKEYLKTTLDDQVFYNKAMGMGFHRTDTNKAILKNIEIIEASNFYYYEVIQKNWGFLPKEVEARYSRDKKGFLRQSPFVKDSTKPTPEEKKALAEYKKNPYQPLETVRATILRRMLMDKPENKKILDSLGAAKVDSSVIYQKQDELINAHVTGLDERMFEKIKTDRNVKTFEWTPEVKPEEVRAEWEKTKNQYKRRPDMFVQHIEVKDEKVAKKIVDDCNNKGGDFAKIQKKLSINKNTVGQEITVKADAEVPGLPGDTRNIYPRLVYLAEGKITDPIALQYSATEGSYNVFKLVRKEPESIMTFEEAAEQVKLSLLTSKQSAIPDEFVVAEIDGKRKITAGELFTLLYKNNPMIVERYKAAEGRKMLLEKYYLRFVLFNDLAKKEGVLSDKALKARVEQQKKGFIVADFKQTYHDVYQGVSPKEVRKYYDANPDSFKTPDGKSVRPFEEVRSICIDKALLNDKQVRDYYTFNQEDFAEGDAAAPSYDAVSTTVFRTVVGKEKARRLDETMKSYRKEFGLKIYDKKLNYDIAQTENEMFEAAKKYHEERQYSQAMKLYQDIRYLYPDFASHPDICMAMAQVYIEQNQYNRAIQEYKRYMRLYKDKGDSYKAQFMIGFVYSENLKDNEKAKAAYQVVKDSYPQCDLADDADFMIKSIENGGEFMFNDSTIAGDSAAQ
ncbi:MAG: peptidyl-prolyl cis-trans isomerase [Fibrobacteres bacterium]|nr:peptidyl-prolyl cis-trans isomerase [Fibrobacterota bacterium]